jgi:hypothetical protein
MVFQELNKSLPDHAGRAQNANFMLDLHSSRPSSVQETSFPYTLRSRIRPRPMTKKVLPVSI